MTKIDHQVSRLAARKTLCKRIGAAITTTMADTDTSFEEISEKLGWSSGLARSMVLTLLNGRPIALERIADIMFSMGVTLSLTFWTTPSQSTAKDAYDAACRVVDRGGALNMASDGILENVLGELATLAEVK